MQKFLKKIIYLFISIIIFSIIYLFFDNHHFAGLNKIQDKLKEDQIEEKTEEVKKDVLETFYTFVEKQDPEEEITENVEKVVENEKEKIEKPTLFQNLFDRFYFSIITACLVGYGDIFPSTNILKLIVSLQTLITVCLILY